MANRRMQYRSEASREASFSRFFIIVVGAFTLFALAACESNHLAPGDEEVDVSEMQAIMESDGIVQRVAYEGLKNSEKLFIWSRKVDLLLEDERWARTQRQIILKLRGIAERVFSAETGVSRYASAKMTESWLDQAEPLFSKSEIHMIGYTLQVDYDEYTEGLPRKKKSELSNDGNYSTSNECVCSVGSRYTCGRVVGIGPSGVQVEYGTCGSTMACILEQRDDGPSDGCGFMFLHECDGGSCSWN